MTSPHKAAASDAGPIPASDRSAISISTSASLVAPFLSEHVPQHYHIQTDSDAPSPPAEDVVMTKSPSGYCYRHRPDMKCRKEADETAMQEIQNVSYIAGRFATARR